MAPCYDNDERWRFIPFLSLIGLVFVLPWRVMVTVDLFGRETSLFLFIVPIVGFFWLFDVFRTERIKSIADFHFYYFLFLGWCILSIAWSINDTKSLKALVTLLMVGMLLLVIWDVVYDPQQLDFLLQTFVFGCTLSVFSILINYVTHNTYGRHEAQYSAIGYNPNDLSIIIALSIGIAYYLLFYSRLNSDKLKYYNLIFILLGSASIILTASRQGFVFLIFASLYGIIMILNGTSVRLWHVIGIVLPVLVVGIQAIPAEVFREISTIPDEIINGKNIRFQIWGVALEAIQNRPLVGYGAGVHQYAYDEFRNATENGFFGILGNTGVVGLLLFSFMIVSSFRQVSNTGNYRLLWICLFILLFLQSLVNNVMFFTTTYVIPSLVVLSATLTE